MKVSGLLAIIICVVVLVGTLAQAQTTTVLIDDDFESYTPGLLIGLDGGGGGISQTSPNGWDWEWGNFYGVWADAGVTTGGNGGQAIGPDTLDTGGYVKSDWAKLFLGQAVEPNNHETLNFSVDLKLGDFSQMFAE